VVGDRQGIHAQLFGPADHRLNGAGSIQKTVVTMAMQMNERRGHDGSLPGKRSRPRPDLDINLPAILPR
jgi:hypothetical protein